MFLYLVQGIGFGLGAAAQPGPLQTFLVSQAMTKGWRRSWINAFAPLVSDGFIVPLVLFGLNQIPAGTQRFLYLAGGVFILYLAYGAGIAWRDFDGSVPSKASPGHRSLFKAALSNILNPLPYIYWGIVTGPILLRGWRENPSNGVAFLLGFYGTFVASLMIIILLFGAAGNLGPRVTRALLGISAGALLFFGLYQLWLGMFDW